MKKSLLALFLTSQISFAHYYSHFYRQNYTMPSNYYNPSYHYYGAFNKRHCFRRFYTHRNYFYAPQRYKRFTYIKRYPFYYHKTPYHTHFYSNPYHHTRYNRYKRKKMFFFHAKRKRFFSKNRYFYKKHFHKKRYNHFNFFYYPKTANLPQSLKDALAYMKNEERMAYELYLKLYSYYQKNYDISIKQFYRIATRSESKHVAIVEGLIKRYNLKNEDFTNIDNSEESKSGVYEISKIQELYDTLYAIGQESIEDALKVGCKVEVTDINDLNKYITEAKKANAQDLQAAFEFLRRGSYHHYWAFDRALKRIGKENGCYVEGDPILTNKEGIYPKR